MDMDKVFFKQWMLLVSVLGLFGAGLGIDLYSDHSRLDRVELDRLGVQARVVGENLDRQLVATYDSLKDIVQDIPAWRQPDGSYSARANRRLDEINDAIPGIRSLLILDRDGIVRASNRPELIGRDFSRRAYFKVPMRGNAPGMLYLTPPFYSVLGTYVMNLSRALQDPEGEFDGVLTASLDPEYFTTLLQSVRYALDMRVYIAHSEGQLFTMVPVQDGQAGRNLNRPGSLFNRHIESGRLENILTGRAQITGGVRIAALRTVNPTAAHMDKGMVVSVSRDPHAIFEGWRLDLAVRTFAYLVISSIAVFWLRVYQRGVRVTAIEAAASLDALKESEARFRSLFERVNVISMLIDPEDGCIVDANPTAEAYYGWPRAELVRKSIFDLSSVLPEEVRQRMQQVLNGQLSYIVSGHRRADGSVRDVELYSGPVQVHGKTLLYAIVHDITERRQAEEALKKSLMEKEMLVRESHHRVKNNLVVIQSLLKLQAAQTGDSAARAVLTESQDRVRAMGMIHEQLYRSRDLSTVNFAEYLRNLVSQIYQSFRAGGSSVKLRMEIPEITLDVDTVIPCGLIVNELVTNALKYAFPDERPGELYVGIEDAPEGGYVLVVRDNGVGMPGGIDINNTKTLGMRIVTMLSQQIGREAGLRTGGGTEFRIYLPPRGEGQPPA